MRRQRQLTVNDDAEVTICVREGSSRAEHQIILVGDPVRQLGRWNCSSGVIDRVINCILHYGVKYYVTVIAISYDLVKLVCLFCFFLPLYGE